MSTREMDVLADLTQRLKKLGISHDPAEGKVLAGWLERGGLESLKSSLLTYVQEATEKSVAPWTITVHKFDEWVAYPFEAFPYTTMEELKQLIDASFKIKDSRLTLYDTKEGMTPLPYRPKETLAEVLGTVKPEDVEAYVLPPYADPFGTATSLNLPVRIYEDEKDEQDILIPITRETPIRDLVDAIGKRFPASRLSNIEFADVTGAQPDESFDNNSKVWKLWQDADYGHVIIHLR